MTDDATHVDEVADGVFRLSTFVEVSGLTFCQYLLRAEQPLLFHTGHRGLFGQVRDAVETVLPASSLRWIGFGHLEADESGSMNEWLAVAPEAEVLSGFTGGLVNLMDLADRPPRPKPTSLMTMRPAPGAIVITSERGDPAGAVISR